MRLEVVIPATRDPKLLLDSLAQQTRPADRITVVSNEAPAAAGTRTLRFRSAEYCYGEADVVLRRNIGIWASDADAIIFQDDDQIAPRTMLEAAEAKLVDREFVWGHHRFIDFAQYAPEVLLDLSPDTGKPRENPPNAYHGHWSCYAGMFGARRVALAEMRGFDMYFLGRHGNEDQNLGLRSMLRAGEAKVPIFEPPFSWHPLQSPPWPVPVETNSCRDHEFEDVTIEGFPFHQCRRCPFRKADEPIFANRVVLPFDPSLVQIREETS